MINIKGYLRALLDICRYYWYNMKLSKIDYFNYEELIKMPELQIPAPFGVNLNYGLFRPIKKIHKGHVNMVTDYIEHGLFYSESASLLEYLIQRKRIGQVFTFSERRKKQIEIVLKKHNRDIPVFAMGPIIPYADNFYSPKKLKMIKEKLGKTLLVIPMHSWKGVNNSFDGDEFMGEVERLKPEFDTVLVCLYYLDIRKGKHIPYLKKGYKIVCNGDRLDSHFICRLRDIIELSDVTMSNGIGTHVGYSISLKRPHYFYFQKMDVAVDEDVKKGEEVEQAYRVDFEKQLNEKFGFYTHVITEEQKQFVRTYWGEF